tara:strand:- start:815 stop:1366 length:552 start_codon:yes stop_codon:yes gene_type:complete
MDAEILAMWPGLPLVHRFLLATGQPLEDIIRMDWSDIDEETRVWYRSSATAQESWNLMIPQWVITWLPKSSAHTGVFVNGTGEPLTSDAVTNQLSKHVSSIGMECVTPEDIRDYVRNQMAEIGNAELAEQIVDQASAIPLARVPLERQVAAQTVLLEQWSYRLQEIVLEGGATLGDTPLSNSH